MSAIEFIVLIFFVAPLIAFPHIRRSVLKKILQIDCYLYKNKNHYQSEGVCKECKSKISSIDIECVTCKRTQHTEDLRNKTINALERVISNLLVPSKERITNKELKELIEELKNKSL